MNIQNIANKLRDAYLKAEFQDKKWVLAARAAIKEFTYIVGMDALAQAAHDAYFMERDHAEDYDYRTLNKEKQEVWKRVASCVILHMLEDGI